MAVELKFTSTERSTDFTFLTVFATNLNEIYIEIKDPIQEEFYDTQRVFLDKQTAIKLAKELRRQISMLEA